MKHPSEVLKKGDVVEAVVLNIDAENQRLSLGLKQLATDMWDEFFAHHKVGRHRRGQDRPPDELRRVRRAAEGIEGLVHVSRAGREARREARGAFKLGDVFPMKIIKINEGEKKIGLTIKAVKQDEFKQDMDSYREAAGSDKRRPLGDAFRAAQAASGERERVVGRQPTRVGRRTSGPPAALRET